ncbi:class I SAM-dependent methyltransferase [Thiospirillum jenense]|uniref:Class I SAM-dependent methyltransferase n=1 Tax=Thiospirillum jenense TaxID=1653858 RepID=A0A839HAQ1_9GAMM|nr:class I SAM-dependent methyltransferase [Thiospirillum jenense]MBB1125340.1 class I SAM-dependent methyltransferase [Thiospirillum jenense]
MTTPDFQPAAASVAEQCHQLGRQFDDAAWLELLIASIQAPVQQGVQMPYFPDDALQIGMVGTAGEQPLREAARFWQQIKHYYQQHGARALADSTVLDFGSGWGRYMRLLLKDVPPERLVGVDVDADFVKLSQALLPGAQFQVVPPLPPCDLPAQSFDLIYAYSVFSHLSEAAHLAWVEEFARLLQPGGMVIVTTQRRGFLDFCESLRHQQDLDSLWHLYLSQSFLDVELAKQQYDNGEFLYSATGGGGPREASFYGEAVVAPGYVQRHWRAWYDIITFIDDEAICPQAIIVAKKK